MASPVLVTAALGIVLSSCSSAAAGPGSANPTPTEATADSLVLERTVCYGFCPAYRLRIDSRGRVHFQSRNPGDGARTATDTIPASAFVWLIGEAERVGIYQLPARIQSDTTLCGRLRTDSPTVTTTIYSSDEITRVEHYTGCAGPRNASGPFERLRQLTPFYSAVDSIAGAARWIRPPRSRLLP